MPIDCLNPPCTPSLPIGFTIGMYGVEGTRDYSDCSMNLLYLTDNPGLINQLDPNSDVLLTTDSRVYRLETANDLALHYSPCDRLYWEIAKYFGWDVGVLKRPYSIVLGYWDSANETMVEAVEAIQTCNPCFVTFTHTLYDINDVPLFDTVPSSNLGEWATLNSYKMFVQPTAQEDLLVNPEETSSFAYQAKFNKWCNVAFQLINEVCIDELDENCEPTGNVLNSYDINHLGLAAVMSSISEYSQDYSFTVKFSPKYDDQLDESQAFSDLTTARLGFDESRYVVGLNPYNDPVIDPTYPHHVNIYHRVGQRDIFVEGLTAVGEYIDTVLQRIHIRNTLERDLFEMLHQEQYVSLSDLAKIQNQLTSTILTLVGQNIISRVPKSFNKTGFDDEIFLEGNGWVLLKTEQERKFSNHRITPTFTFCYVKPGVAHFISLTLCKDNMCGGNVLEVS